jgi:DnaJ-domain-containing protein 1
VDQIFDRFERLFKSWVVGSNGSAGETADPFGRDGFRGSRSSGDPDLDSAMDELDDYLNVGRTETEAKERERARREREREESARRASNSHAAYSRPTGPPPALVQAYRSLGLAYGAPFPEVKAAYKKLLMLNHPDRNSATPEQLKRSTEISAQLNAAYHMIETWNSTGKLDDA